jgi:hypothetical protein
VREKREKIKFKKSESFALMSRAKGREGGRKEGGNGTTDKTDRDKHSSGRYRRSGQASKSSGSWLLLLLLVGVSF